MLSVHSAPASAAAFILAPQAPTTTLTDEGRVKPLNHLNLLNPHARQGVSMQAPKGALFCAAFARLATYGGPPLPASRDFPRKREQNNPFLA